VRDIAEITRLEFGDAMIVGQGPDDEPVLVGVEVKSIHDLISSMNTGRLQAHQVPGLLRDFGQPWLLWFGSVRAGRDGRLEIRRGQGWKAFRLGSRDVPYGYLHSFLFELSVAGIKVAHVYDESEAAAWLACLHRWWSKPWDKHKGLRTLDNSRSITLVPGMDRGVRMRATVAAALPGVGFERAFAAASHFSSVVSMVCASTQEWEQVPGVGKVVAKAVVTAMREDT
jgi:ERCC4-type nuclease